MAPTSKIDLRSQLYTRQDYSSDVTLQIQLDKALAELRDVQAENNRLAKEKEGWQDKLDSMQHKLSVAEPQLRCLDHLARHKLESRQKAGYSQPRRRGLFPPTPASMDVIEAMCALNKEIYWTCLQFAAHLEHTSKVMYTPEAQKVLGDHLTALMKDQAKKTTPGYSVLLMQTVFEVFMTHWCSSIIEAFYPQQESFTDLLIQLSTETLGSAATCGKRNQIIQPSNTNFDEWVKHIIEELEQFLMIAGLRMKTYDIRTAMAEKDICGGLEVVIVAPETPFQDKWMTDGHADVGEMDQSYVEFVAGTIGLGLQRGVLEYVDGIFHSRINVELKPKVILAHALKVNL